MNIYVVDIVMDGDERFSAFRNEGDAVNYLKSQIGEYFLNILRDGKEDPEVINFIKDDMKDFCEYKDESLTEYVIGDIHYKLMTTPIN